MRICVPRGIGNQRNGPEGQSRAPVRYAKVGESQTSVRRLIPTKVKMHSVGPRYRDYACVAADRRAALLSPLLRIQGKSTLALNMRGPRMHPMALEAVH
jgi:hypothetical protein